MKRRLSVAFWMMSAIAICGGLVALSMRYEGCAEKQVEPPEPTCGLDPAPLSPRGVVADAIRRDAAWWLARDDDRAAIVVSETAALFVLAAAGEPHEVIARAIEALPAETRAAMSRTQPLLLWIDGDPSTPARYPGCSDALDVQLFHDVVALGCFVRITPPDDPEVRLSRRKANRYKKHVAEVDAAIIAALRDGNRTQLSADESTARMREAVPRLRALAQVAQRTRYMPASVLLQPGRWFLAGERAGTATFLALNFVLGLGLGASLLPGVSMAAHVGGAVAGFLVTITGVVLLGRPALGAGDKTELAAAIAWGIAGFCVIAWIVAGIVVQRGRNDL